MATILLEMSTDAEIRTEQLSPQWGAVDNVRLVWGAVNRGLRRIGSGDRVVITAHGCNESIGNAAAGTIDLYADEVIRLLQSLMKDSGAPSSVYVACCAEGYAGFAAALSRCAAADDIEAWHDVTFLGHDKSIGAGSIPPPSGVEWIAIYSKRTRSG